MADLAPPPRVLYMDVERGVVESAWGERVVLVTAEAIDMLANALGPAALPALGRSIGGAMGRAAARSLGGPEGVAEASLDAVAHALGLELALRGLGLLSIERWGRALILALDGPAIADDELNAQILEGALSMATARSTPCLPLGREGSVMRILVASVRTAARARGMLAAGLAWGDVLARLHSGGTA
jgi:hypothetical protein